MEKIEIPKGCGKNMGDVNCGHKETNFDKNTGELNIQILYCKECSKEVKND